MPEQAATGGIPERRSCCNSTDDVGHDFTCPEMLAAAGVTPDAAIALTDRGFRWDQEPVIMPYRTDRDWVQEWADQEQALDNP